MTYPDSVRFLYALGNEIKSVKLGLGPVRELLRELGDPQDHYRIIHVAGTNGKGSTCAMIEAGLRAAGFRTGLYTSPHLIEPTERIRVDGAPITTAQFERAFDAVHEAALRLEARGVIDAHPTYFETVTAMAFLFFRDAEIEYLVCETGLGGRLDATNVVHPVLCVITPIDFDHEQYLGNTIELIAGEKAGIIKPGVPVVCAPQRPEALAVLQKRAKELAAPVLLTTDWPVEDLAVTARGCRFRVNGFHIACPLAGPHQLDNALSAVRALVQLGINPEGISQAVWPGRLELLSRDPEIIVDGAHNPAGARALAAYIDRFYSGRPIRLIYGTMRDKAVEEIAGILFPRAERIVVTAPESQRALRPEMLAEAFPGTPIAAARDFGEALELAKQDLPADGAIFVTGSLYLVGEARQWLLGKDLL